MLKKFISDKSKIMYTWKSILVIIRALFFTVCLFIHINSKPALNTSSMTKTKPPETFTQGKLSAIYTELSQA